ncbi:S1 family peptidase [Streptomyces rapamycinicus]|uniref:Peptidase n=1 Tax=Streptomyces rapamycinicus (strain ATCC 29253 / DSM 41530 / NRRL 5491 / AYB-994) TaxID=1343740 RepID=A0A3L8R5F2_STRRN|nr:peptidase [Streptomyces rapamycinicus NRRL 5491]UTO61054.1 S1 family peptidase [Streptomyces rapamycinicus]
MSHRRVNKRTLAISGAAITALGAAAILLPNANANPDETSGAKTFSSPAAVKLARSLASDLGDNGAGWYYDNGNRQLVMNVVDEDSAESVRAKGAVAKVVQNSMADLKAATQTLSSDASVPGTAWSIDPVTNKVQVTADRTVTGTKWDTLTKSTGQMADTVSVKRSQGEFKKFDGEEAAQPGDNGGAGAGDAAGDAGDAGAGDAAGTAGGAGDAGAGGADDAGAGGAGDAAGGAGDAAGGAGDAAGGAGDAGGGGDAAAGGLDGGDAIFGGGARCSLGFNVSVDGAPGFLTAGHCGNESQTWTSDEAGAQQVGTVQDSKFPENDFALVMYDDATTQPSSTVDLQNGNTQEIGRAVEASVGLKVQRSGSTTGVTDGTVTGLNATVNYGNGDIVNGLIQTDVCAEPGDSGGAMFAEDAAVGLTSGGSGDCTQGGETFFQPVTAALEATGAVIGADGGGAGDAAGGAGDAAGGAGDAAGGAGDAAGGAGDAAGAGNAGAGDAAGGADDAGAGNAGAGDAGAAAGAGDTGSVAGQGLN